MARKEWKLFWPGTVCPVHIPPETLADSWQAFLLENVQVLVLFLLRKLCVHIAAFQESEAEGLSEPKVVLCLVSVEAFVFKHLLENK